MSAPPIGMMMSTPSRNETAAISQNASVLLAARRTRRSSATSATPSARLITCRPGRMIGLPLMRPESFRNAITEPVKVMAPIASPSDISIRLWPWIAPTAPMSKAARRVERTGRDQHRGHADQRMEGGDQFRHRGHRHAPRDHRAGAAADARRRRPPAPRRRSRPADARRASSRPRSPCRSCRTDCRAGSSPGSTGRAAPG